MFLVNLTSNKSFEISPEQTILEAASLRGIAIPYSCNSGRCSACKCKVIRGTTLAIKHEDGLSDKEKTDGWILSCARTANSNLELAVENLDKFTLPAIKNLPARIDSINRLASNVSIVTLRLPPTAEFDFIPGQFINVIGPKGIQRSYSLANSDLAERKLELHIRFVDGGVMSQYWFDHAKVNDLVRINGPLGTFFLRDLKGLDLVFLATGTGIAPIKSMLNSLLALSPDEQPLSVTLLWGGRTRGDLYMHPLTTSVGYHYVPVLSRADSEWVGACGYVQNVFLSLSPNLSNSIIYACGSAEMIHGAQTSLAAVGLPSHRFYSDAFICSS
jgi:CDP-4-dehydro-6-deoxyglucose reductase, E3